MRDIGTRIKKLREQLGWTQTKLATLSGVSQSFLWRLEGGKTNGSWDTYVKIAGALGVSVDTFFASKSNVGPAPVDWRRIPVLSFAEAAKLAGVDFTPVDLEKHETIMTALEHPPSTFSLRICGNEMEPLFREGDIVVINPTIVPRPGDFVVANEIEGDSIFRQYRIAGINEKGIEVFELWPMNAIYAPVRSDRVKMSVAGTMVEHRRFRQE